jgi:hypothetical protein
MDVDERCDPQRCRRPPREGIPMSMPGFTAEQSLLPSSVEYHYSGSANLHGVSPEFLDFIKEAFESVVDPLKTAAEAAASGIKNAINGLNQAGQGTGQTFTCSGMLGNMFRCSGANPAIGVAQMTQSCFSRAAEVGPEAFPLCGALAGAFYPLLTAYCKSPEGRARPTSSTRSAADG